MNTTLVIVIVAGVILAGLVVVILRQQQKLRRGVPRISQNDANLSPTPPALPSPEQRRQALTRLRRQLDAAVSEASNLVSTELYGNCVLPTVRGWFEGNDSIQELNDSIKSNLKQRWKTVEPKVRSRFANFSDETRVVLSDVSGADLSFDSKGLSERISERLSLALGTIITSITAIISGGAGTALIMTGPIGIVIGAVVGALAFFFGKKKLEEILGSFLVDKHIPRIMKKPAMSKVTAELKLKEAQFKEDVETKMQEMVKTVYAEIDNELARLV